ncbi:hypothetical protein [Geminicoccus roseus]|uniref:hypothetical protein n=1 Tax=Geminicoccus roseus TaxID=404900 RepID=UPI000422A3A2|nr:hypothetical protein [Geminicoccus roseus]
MSDSKSVSQRWNEFTPSKTMWFWSCVGTVIATIVVGFGFGGWVTGGSATAMAEDAAERSRVELASDVCVERFMRSPDFGPQLAALKQERSYQRDNVIEDGGWTTLGGMDKPIRNAAALCAEKLVEMEVPLPQASAASATTDDAAVVQ